MDSYTNLRTRVTYSFIVGLAMLATTALAGGQTFVGYANVTDFDVTGYENPREKLPYNTDETAATIAKILITKDGRWKATGKIGLLMFGDTSSGLDMSEGGNTKVLLWNRGHKLTITMEENAVSVIRGKRVRAISRTTFTISDGNESEFEAQIRAGALTKVRNKDLRPFHFTAPATDTGVAKTEKHTPAVGLPAFAAHLNGPREVRVRNPNDFVVQAGVRKDNSGVNLEIPANGTRSVYVPDGKYEIYFVYSNKPDALFKGDDFTLDGHGVEIQIVKVVGGNYGIRQVK